MRINPIHGRKQTKLVFNNGSYQKEQFGDFSFIIEQMELRFTESSLSLIGLHKKKRGL